MEFSRSCSRQIWRMRLISWRWVHFQQNRGKTWSKWPYPGPISTFAAPSSRNPALGESYSPLWFDRCPAEEVLILPSQRHQDNRVIVPTNPKLTDFFLSLHRIRLTCHLVHSISIFSLPFHLFLITKAHLWRRKYFNPIRISVKILNFLKMIFKIVLVGCITNVSLLRIC